MENPTKKKPSRFTPSGYMRARRPHLFSDSRIDPTETLSREILEYHLDTLTSRKDETKFEHFARKLAEHEICPNLLPQTGPTGGGDSKVDSETYPVASEVSRIWYSGIDQRASNERWAFAFSAKKQWLQKVKNDVESIASTGRPYKRIFFITNQFVPDKKRAKAEDALTAEYSIPLNILDRTWILEKVFGNNRIALAIDALGLTPSRKPERSLAGPNDVERQQELDQLDTQISDPARYIGVKYQLAEDCLRSAVLARGLERPRQEIEGRFGRAARISQEAGSVQQQLRIGYARAWTAFWWYDDFIELNRIYSEVESLAKDSDQADDISLLLHLWQLIFASVRHKELEPARADLTTRTATLKHALDRLAGDSRRPNNALLARTDRLLVDLSEAVDDPKRAHAVFDDLEKVVGESGNLVNYPLSRLHDLLIEIGNAFVENSSFDKLFEVINNAIEHRSGQGAAGEALRARGMQKLQGGSPYDAIRLFGRSQIKLAKREFRSEFIFALIGAGLAYEKVGLFWAARSSVLAAAFFALTEFRERGAIVRAAVRAIQKLIWIEIQLGRVPCALAWGELSDVLARHIEASDGSQDDLAEEREARDMALSVLFLRSEIQQLSEIGFLVEVLDELNLAFSEAGLLYALGYEERMRAAGLIPLGETAEAVREVYLKLVNQPDARDLPARPQYLSEPICTLKTKVLGCDIEMSLSNNLSSIYLSEAILGSLEAFLSTSLNRQLYPFRESLRVSIELSDSKLEVPTYEVQDGPKMLVRHSAPIHPDTPQAQARFADWMREVVIRLLTEIAIVADAESYFNEIVGEERALERSLNTAHVETMMQSIMGPSPKIRLEDWKADNGSAVLPLLRSSSWYDSETTKETKEHAGARQPVFGEGEPPSQMLDRERGKHADIRISSVIDIPKWNEAQWMGVGFGVVPGVAPILGLAFRNKDAAAAIFSEWRRRFGEIDQDDVLRISILTGTRRDNPAAYKVVVGTDPLMSEGGEKDVFVITSRINEMIPKTPNNLDTFLRHFTKAGRYFLVPAINDETVGAFEFMRGYGVGKHKLLVRPMWQVGENDPDMVAISADDDPIVPSGIQEIPFQKALLRKQRWSEKKQR
jgi:hypothetical protein